MALKKGNEVELTIESAAFKGKGVAKENGLAVFVPNTAPGDRIRARIIKRKKNFREAKMLELLEPGPDRIKPKCRHAFHCGGCSWQHVDYNAQLRYKTEQVLDHMHRIGGLTDLSVNSALGCEKPFYYRNKMEYSVGNRRWLSREEIERDEFVSDRGFAAGMHAPGRFDKILDLKECHLQHPVSFKILDYVRSHCINEEIPPFDTVEKTGFMRNIVVRTSHYTDDLMVNLVTFKDQPDTMETMSEALLREFPGITTIVNNINDRHNPTAVGRYEKVLYGPGFITDYIGKYRFEIDANSFFQTNTQQAEVLFDIARSFADLQEDETVYDLYCGVGTLSLFVSDFVKEVVGIELVDVAVENARTNAAKNDTENVSFIKGDMRETFTGKIIEEYGRPDCILTDPPRAGMHPDVVEHLKELKVPKLVYVSCNSSTMARDLKELKEVYDIEEVQPVDMFPQTYHIETVAKLRLKE
jgi:23S rRNA (uracil1939-C5)-methyltransferase